MEKALFIKKNSIQLVDRVLTPPLPKNDDSIAAKQITLFKEQAIENFQGDWAQFFIDFKEQATNGFNCLQEQNHNLYRQNLELMKNLTVVREEIDFMRKERERKEVIRNKRKKAQKQNLRDSISEDEFFHILKSVKKDHFVPSRRKAGLILLYITGLKRSNLLLLKIHKIDQLFDKGSTTIPLIKRASSKYLLSLSKKSKHIIHQFHSSFLTLMKNKDRDSFLFTTTVKLHKPIDRLSFSHEINNVLIISILSQPYKNTYLQSFYHY